jgi:hypothetical protein
MAGFETDVNSERAKIIMCLYDFAEKRRMITMTYQKTRKISMILIGAIMLLSLFPMFSLPDVAASLSSSSIKFRAVNTFNVFSYAEYDDGALFIGIWAVIAFLFWPGLALIFSYMGKHIPAVVFLGLDVMPGFGFAFLTCSAWGAEETRGSIFPLFIIPLLIVAIVYTSKAIAKKNRMNMASQDGSQNVCPNCGMVNASDTNFCMACGSPLQSASQNQTM